MKDLVFLQEGEMIVFIIILFMTRVVVYKIQHTYLEEGASNETFYIYS